MHLEDQRSGSKKCGHMAGKVLTSTAEHIDRLCAARLQADVSGSELVLISRTDAEAGGMKMKGAPGASNQYSASTHHTLHHVSFLS